MEYIKLDVKAIYQQLTSKIFMSPQEGNDIVSQLKETPRYNNDSDFRVVIITCECLCASIFGCFSKALDLLQFAISEAGRRRMYRVQCFAYNILGNTYENLSILDKALETYQIIIKIEQKYNFLHMTPVAYNNIGDLYCILGDDARAFYYYKRACKDIYIGDLDYYRYISHYTYFRSSLAIQYCVHGMLDNAKRCLEEVDSVTFEDIDGFSQSIIHKSKMVYHMYSENYNKAKTHYKKAFRIASSIPDNQYLLGLTATFAEMCQRASLPYSVYISEIRFVEKQEYKEHFYNLTRIYSVILAYYKSINDLPNTLTTYEKYIHYSKLNSEYIRKQQRDAMNIRFDIEATKEENAIILQKNEALRTMTQRAIEHKEALENAYKKNQTIMRIGQKITSSLDMLEVVNLIYDNIKSRLSLKVFLLLVSDTEKKQLRTIAFYENDLKQKGFELPIDSPNSFLAKCFRTREPIVINNVKRVALLDENELIFTSGEPINSVAYFPIKYDSSAIGVFSVQSSDCDVFNDETLMFINEFETFIAIALNNAIKSKALKHEIAAHKITQKKLRELNRNLQDLSSLDGLTKVFNRRAFDEKYKQLLNKAIHHCYDITVMMIDIDYFKNYNDYYGHLEGDKVLMQVAQKINLAFVNDNAFFARFGGEEFIAVAINYDYKQMLKLANQIRVAVSELCIINENADSGYLTISIGCAMTRPKSTKIKSELIRMADICLYKAKDKGRNAIESIYIESSLEDA